MNFIVTTLFKNSRKAYDGLAKSVESTYDVFPVCFCARHRCFPLSPTWGAA
jgi:hypothetical protein